MNFDFSFNIKFIHQFKVTHEIDNRFKNKRHLRYFIWKYIISTNNINRMAKWNQHRNSLSFPTVFNSKYNKIMWFFKFWTTKRLDKKFNMWIDSNFLILSYNKLLHWNTEQQNISMEVLSNRYIMYVTSNY